MSATQTQRCRRCHQNCEVHWAEHPEGGLYVTHVSGWCALAPDQRSPYHDPALSQMGRGGTDG